MMFSTIRYSRGNLPHWLVADRPYFVTIRLAGSLPARVIEQLKLEREELAHKSGLDVESWSKLQQRQFDEIERTLNAGSANLMLLAKPEAAGVVFDNFDWLEKQCGWRIYAATVMGNHAHILMRNMTGRNGELIGDLARFKSFTAARINNVLERKGKLWAREDFDHWCRNDEKTHSAARYICLNPVKAGLVKIWQNWPWTRCLEDFQP